MTHTPGPWNITPPPQPFAAGDGFRVSANGDQTNWRGYITNILAGSPNAEANARLIAAAPDLLAALKLADTILDGFPLYKSGEGAKTIRAAIAKAEGKS